jgi:hypothetical protein
MKLLDVTGDTFSNARHIRKRARLWRFVVTRVPSMLATEVLFVSQTLHVLPNNLER